MEFAQISSVSTNFISFPFFSWGISWRTIFLFLPSVHVNHWLFIFKTSPILNRWLLWHWRRQDFFLEGAHRPLKGYNVPTQGVRRRQPRTREKFKIWQWFNILENESIFQEFQDFSCPSPKDPLFLRKIEKLKIFF